MDIKSSYAQFRQTVQSFIKDNPRALDTRRPDPYQLHNKAYRDHVVSTNIFRKSLQLYNDIVGTPLQAEKAATNVRDYLSQIRAKSVIDVLRSHVKIDIGTLADSIRGGAFDKKE
jgi:hypothetical protein